MADDEAMVEAMARALCRRQWHWGDPEPVVQQRVDDGWREYQPEARALLPLIQSHTAAAVAEAVEGEDLLGQFGAHSNWELSHFGFEGEDEWQVHKVNGGKNDREWTLIGTGNTPAEAIGDAIRQGDGG